MLNYTMVLIHIVQTVFKSCFIIALLMKQECIVSSLMCSGVCHIPVDASRLHIVHTSVCGTTVVSYYSGAVQPLPDND